MSSVQVPTTMARVNMTIANNGTWMDAFQIGTPGDLTWSFTGQNFRVDVKADRLSSIPLLTLSTPLGTIVVDDPIQRVLHFNVSEQILAAANLVPGEYWYDLVMYDASSPSVRVPLMGGKLKVKLGITGG